MTVSYPEVYLLEEVREILQDIFKYGDVLKSLFRVKPVDRNGLWEPIMGQEAHHFFDLVNDLCRSKSIPQKH